MDLPPRLWRPLRKERSLSLDQPFDCKEGWTFDLKAPIVDFFEHDYITQFAPLCEILDGKADEIMDKAYKQDVIGQNYIPRTSGGYKFRWIHIPANNMPWVEETIKRVCESKDKKAREKESKREKDDKSANAMDETVPKVLRAADILSSEFWKDQQRGCLEHCANHPLYARHMIPFFAEIPTDWESKTASKVAPYTETAIIVEVPASTTPVSGEAISKISGKVETVLRKELSIPAPTLALGAKLATETTSLDKAKHANMVLFMPFLHWATSGPNFKHRDAVIKELAEQFKDPDYQRPSLGTINRIESAPKMKVLRAFLHPARDSCLHIRRTLDQYYYSTIEDADQRTEDQVVYKFAKKQHYRIMEEERKADDRRRRKENERITGRMVERAVETESQRKLHSRSSIESVTAAGETDSALDLDGDGAFRRKSEPSWDPPKLIMVNQLWMWIIDGDTVITSFPSKAKSGLSIDDAADRRDFMEGDLLYDSTDIWRAVQKELRNKTNYGQRTAKSALDLAWTIADQAQGVFHKRNLHPHLQFIQMFEMEINEITFNQAKAFAAFSRNVQAAHNANNIGKLLTSLVVFQKDIYPTSRAETWKANFERFACDFEKRLEVVVSGIHIGMVGTPIHSLATSRTQIESEINVPNKLKRILTDTSIDSESWALQLKRMYNQLEETIENAHTIGLSNLHIEAQILDVLSECFTELKLLVERSRTTSSLNRKLNCLVESSLKSIDRYTEMVMDDLFDITNETSLVSEIKDILDELNIISCVSKHQAAVIEPFMLEMLHQTPDTKDKDFHDGARLRNRIDELQSAAQSTYAALQDLLDLKQKQASVIEARSARRDAKASADQAEAATSLANQTVRQGWSIMIFTIVTIIFLPLSFFTGLFGMNAKEWMSAEYSLGFYSAIMYPISFVIICVSLGLALNTDFRLLVQLALRKTLHFTFISRLWRTKFGLAACFGAISKSVEREKSKRRATHKYKKWEV